jgi:hypothetical protein
LLLLNRPSFHYLFPPSTGMSILSGTKMFFSQFPFFLKKKSSQSFIVDSDELHILAWENDGPCSPEMTRIMSPIIGSCPIAPCFLCLVLGFRAFTGRDATNTIELERQTANSDYNPPQSMGSQYLCAYTRNLAGPSPGIIHP